MFDESCLPSRILTQKHHHGLAVKVTTCLWTNNTLINNNRNRSQISNTQQHFSPKPNMKYTYFFLEKDMIIYSRTSPTNMGETKSLNRYVTSRGFSFLVYNLFNPSTIEVTDVKEIWQHTRKKKSRDPRNKIL